jgi:catechol 2,3-dioxygenase-like lactoylglutathione lyase family enzyme
MTVPLDQYTFQFFLNRQGALNMIGYVTLGTNNLPRAAAFYDALLAEIGAKRLMDYGRGYSYGESMDKPTLGIVIPYDTKPATVGNGVMVALGVDSQATVDRVHKKALKLGGTDEGPPGPRGEDFYAGYFRDLDGNKLSVFYAG